MSRSPVYRISFTWNKSANLQISNADFANHYSTILKTIILRYPKSKVVFQLEQAGTTGTLHYQGHVKLAQKIRTLQWAKEMRDIMPGVHVSPDSTRGSKDAEFYCMKKDETHVAGPWYDPHFTPPYQGEDLLQLNQFYLWQQKVFNLIQGEIHPDKITWICQEEGGAGKSSFVKHMVYHGKALYMTLCKSSDLTNFVYKMDSSRCYLIDVARTKGADQNMDDLYNAIEQLKNGLIFNSKYETGYKIMKKPHVVVFSNEMPDLTKLSSYKWNVHRIIGHDIPTIAITEPSSTEQELSVEEPVDASASVAQEYADSANESHSQSGVEQIVSA